MENLDSLLVKLDHFLALSFLPSNDPLWLGGLLLRTWLTWKHWNAMSVVDRWMDGCMDRYKHTLRIVFCVYVYTSPIISSVCMYAYTCIYDHLSIEMYPCTLKFINGFKLFKYL